MLGCYDYITLISKVFFDGQHFAPLYQRVSHYQQFGKLLALAL
jgi:hypothetical protein